MPTAQDLERVLAMRCPTHLTQSLVTAVKASPAHPPRRDIALEDRSVGSVVVDDRDAQPGEGRGGLRPPHLLRRLVETDAPQQRLAHQLIEIAAAYAQQLAIA